MKINLTKASIGKITPQPRQFFVWDSKVSGFLFSNVEGQPLSNMAMYRILKNRCHADKFTVHGFRNAFRTWCADTDVDFYAAETCIAHSVQTAVQDAHQRSDLLEARTKIMQDWADSVMSEC